MTTTPATHESQEVDEHHERPHPSDKQYVIIGLILAAMTAVEVGLYYVDIGSLNNTTLILLAVVKFFIVAAFFMHLRFDRPILRRLFVTGIVLAIAVYMAYLTTLGAYIPGG
ncbi:MAG TPA: cytochrome C oxidase subunit IV family protein [Acidimicrobiales bacterium]|nr:cytochrome C oxidase subunit IV family protein [Acidimicrobiales bacterium]